MIVSFIWTDGYRDRLRIPRLESVFTRVLENRRDKKKVFDGWPSSLSPDGVAVHLVHFVLRRYSNDTFEYVQES
jgi:hypothetical protein